MEAGTPAVARVVLPHVSVTAITSDAVLKPAPDMQGYRRRHTPSEPGPVSFFLLFYLATLFLSLHKSSESHLVTLKSKTMMTELIHGENQGEKC